MNNNDSNYIKNKNFNHGNDNNGNDIFNYEWQT